MTVISSMLGLSTSVKKNQTHEFEADAIELRSCLLAMLYIAVTPYGLTYLSAMFSSSNASHSPLYLTLDDLFVWTYFLVSTLGSIVIHG